MLTLVIETLLGSATGYITNDIALKQLFREDGIVENERAAFTTMLVQMLQEEIFQEETLAEVAAEPAVVEFFDELMESLLHKILPEILKENEVELNYAMAEGFEILRERLSAQETLELRLEEEKLLALVDRIFSKEVMDQLASSRLKDWELDRLARKAWRGLSAWQGEDQLPKESRKLLSAALAPLLACITERFSHIDSRRELIRRCLKLPEDNQGDAILESLAVFLERYHKPILESWKLQRDALEMSAKNIIHRLLRVLSESLYPQRYQLTMHMLRSVEKGTESIPSFLQGGIQSLAAQKLDPEGSFIEELFVLLKTESLAQSLAKKLFRRLDQEIQDFFERMEEGAGLEELFKEQWEKIPKDLRQSMSLGIQKQLDGPIFSDTAKEKAFESLLLTAIIKLLESLLYQKSWAVKIDKKLAELGELPLHYLLANIQSYYEDQGRERLSILLRRGFSNKGILNVLDRFLKKAQKNSIVDLYDQVLQSFHETSDRGIDPEKALAKLVRKKAFEQVPSFLGRVTRQRLDALSQKEIRELVVDLLGREMKPLTYLGAVVGAVAGAATGTVFSLSGYSPDPRSGAEAAALFAGRSLFYGGIGYGTNVLAVRGLFRPYEKVLSWQGLLPKNKDRFSKNMVQLAETYILNEEIWQSFGQEAKTYWELHRSSLVERFLTGSWIEKCEELSDRLWPELNGRCFLNVAHRHLEHPLVHQKLSQLSRRIFFSWLENELSKEQNARMVSLLRGLDSFREELFKDLLDHRGFDIYPIINKWMEKPIFKQGKGKKFGQEVSRLALSQAQIFLVRQKKALTRNLADLIFEELSSLQQLAFAIGDGEKYIGRIVDDFVHQELEIFLGKEGEVLSNSISQVFDDVFTHTSLKDLGFSLSQERFESFLRKGIEILDRRFEQWGQENFEKEGLDFLRGLQEKLLIQQKLSQGYWLDALWKQSSLQVSDLDRLRRYALEEFCGTPVIKTALGKSLLEWITMDDQVRLKDAMKKFCCSPAELLDGPTQRMFLVYGDASYSRLIDFILEEGAPWIDHLNLPKIVAGRVEALDPEELEELIRKIADPYFHHVERMGWIGALVAVPASVLVTSIS